MSGSHAALEEVAGEMLLQGHGYCVETKSACVDVETRLGKGVGEHAQGLECVVFTIDGVLKKVF